MMMRIKPVQRLSAVLLAVLMVATTIPMGAMGIKQAEASVAGHVVISEILYDEHGTDENEFIELYNPTNAAINISSWQIEHFNQTGASQSVITIPTSTEVAPYSYFLIGEKDPLTPRNIDGTPSGISIVPDLLKGVGDWQNGPGDGIVLKNSAGTVVDGLQWGTGSSTAGEGNPAPDVSSGNSLERKSDAGGVTDGQGNGWDTNDNASDFVTSTPNPQNSSSPAEPDTTLPTITSALANTATEVVLTVSEALYGITADPSAFTVHIGTGTDKGKTTVATVSGATHNEVTLTLCSNGTTIAHNDNVTVDYAASGINDLQDMAHNPMANFTGQAVTNDVPAEQAPASFTVAPTTLTEAATNDGTLTAPGTVTITLANDTFVTGAITATANNLPAGLTVGTVTRVSDTQITVAVTGTATNHAVANNIANLTFTVAHAQLTSANADVTTPNIAVTFSDPAGGGTITVTAPTTAVTSQTNQTKTLDITIANVAGQDMNAGQFELHYDHTKVEVTALAAGAVLSNATFQSDLANAASGNVSMNWAQTGPVTTDGVLVQVTLKLKGTGATTLNIQNLQLENATTSPVTALTSSDVDGTLTVTIDDTAPAFASAATSADGKTVTITMDEALANPSVDKANFTVKATGQADQTPTAATVSGTKVILTLATAINQGVTVTVDYTAGAAGTVTNLQDAVGNETASFTGQPVTNHSTVTGDNNPPVKQSVSPTDLSIAVATGAVVEVTFNETIQAGTTINDIAITANGTAVSITPVVNGSILTLTPANGLVADTIYTVTVPIGAVKDSAGNPTTTVTTWSFATAKLGDLNTGGTLDPGDVTLVLQAALGVNALSPIQIKIADVDGGGLVTAGDGALILRKIAGQTTGVPGW